MKKSVILVGLFCSSLFAGDVIITPGGGSGSSDAAKLQGKEISTNTPTASQALVWNDTIKQWVPTSISVASTVSDTAYDATSWDGVTTLAPSKNAVRDKIETLVTSGGALGTPSSGTVTNLTGTASININGTVGATTANTGEFTNVTLSGNQSAAAWTTSGLRLKDISGTLTDTTSSGTVAAAYTNKLGGNTIAASSATTFTDYISGYFSEPVAGTNVTLTNKWGLGADSLYVGTSNPFKVTSAGAVSVGSSLTLGTSGILLGGTNTIEQRNSTNAQTFNIYNTFTDTSNYERATIGWNSNQLLFQASTLGSGTLRAVGISRASAASFGLSASASASFTWTINTSGHLITNSDNSYDVGASGANRPRDLFLGRNAAIGGTTAIADTTDSTTSTTGSLKTAGGLGVAKAVNVGTTLNVTGVSTLAGGGTSTTATAGDNTTQIATTAFVKAAVPTASYRMILQSNGKATAGQTAGTYVFSATNGTLQVSGGNLQFAADLINIVGADYPTVNGGTTTMRIRAEMVTNATAPTTTFTVGLYPLSSVAGAVNQNTYTLGTVVSGSTVAFTTQAASTVGTGVSTDFAIPADGVYALGVVMSGTNAASSQELITVHLQTRN